MYGQSGIYWCDTRALVAAGTTWTQIATVLEGTVNISESEAGMTPISVEEIDTPLVIIYGANGPTTYTADIPDLSSDVVASLFGAVADVTNTNVYREPDAKAEKSGMFLYVPKSGPKLCFTNAKLKANKNGNPSKTGTMNIHVQVVAQEGGDGVAAESTGVMWIY
ncbi:MAG: hypothetical protein ABFC84_13370 [Veillonellales bacterium]